MRHQIPTLVAAILLLASVPVQNLWTSDRPAHAAGSDRLDLDRVPLSIGDWEGTDLELRAEHLAIAEAAGSLARRYINRANGHELVMVLICGKPGPIAVHPPTACYRGAGFGALGEPRRHAVKQAASDNGHTDTFLVADFCKPGPISNGAVRIFWAWSSNGHWQVPSAPRLEFVGVPLLFKLYVTQEMTSEKELISGSGPEAFIRDLLPVIHESLFRPRDAQ